MFHDFYLSTKCLYCPYKRNGNFDVRTYFVVARQHNFNTQNLAWQTKHSISLHLINYKIMFIANLLSVVFYKETRSFETYNPFVAKTGVSFVCCSA